MAILRRSSEISSFSGLCITKLDVLDTVGDLKICTGYKLHGEEISVLPTTAADLLACEPIYEEMPGWEESTLGVKSFKDLPNNAQKYLLRIEELAGVPIDIISTGPDRAETIILRNPLDEEMKADSTLLA